MAAPPFEGMKRAQPTRRNLIDQRPPALLYELQDRAFMCRKARNRDERLKERDYVCHLWLSERRQPGLPPTDFGVPPHGVEAALGRAGGVSPGAEVAVSEDVGAGVSDGTAVSVDVGGAVGLKVGGTNGVGESDAVGLEVGVGETVLVAVELAVGVRELTGVKVSVIVGVVVARLASKAGANANATTPRQ
jgi:hypothetical protein